MGFSGNLWLFGLVLLLLLLLSAKLSVACNMRRVSEDLSRSTPPPPPPVFGGDSQLELLITGDSGSGGRLLISLFKRTGLEGSLLDTGYGLREGNCGEVLVLSAASVPLVVEGDCKGLLKQLLDVVSLN